MSEGRGGAGLLAHSLACAWLQYTHCILQHMVHDILDLGDGGGEGRGGEGRMMGDGRGVEKEEERGRVHNKVTI